MARSPKKERRAEPQWFELRVSAAAVSVGQIGPKILAQEPEGEARTYITVVGALDRPAPKGLDAATIQISDGDKRTGNPGAAIGGASVWHVACSLPRGQFDDLLALVLAGKLVKVDLLFESLKRGSGVLRSIDFRTDPVSSEEEQNDERLAVGSRDDVQRA
jgi:hypothetical protein